MRRVTVDTVIAVTLNTLELNKIDGDLVVQQQQQQQQANTSEYTHIYYCLYIYID